MTWKLWRTLTGQGGGTHTVLDLGGFVLRYADLLFVELDRLPEFHKVVAESDQVSKTDVMLRVNQHNKRQMELGRAPLYRVERFALDNFGSIGYDLVCCLFEIRNVALLRCELKLKKPLSYHVWLEANAANCLPIRLLNKSFYFVTGHASTVCKHALKSR